MENIKLVNDLYSLLPTSTPCSKKSAIYDTGESGNFLHADKTHDIEIRPVAPIQVKYSNVQILHSTKGCRQVLTTLTDEVRESHIIPRLAHKSLISINKLCDARSEASFKQNTTAITKDEQVVFKEQGTQLQAYIEHLYKLVAFGI